MPKFEDLTDCKFGRWTVQCRAKDYRPGIPQWHCICKCGNEGVVRAGILKAGHSRSCGCLNAEVQRQKCVSRNTTHGQSKTRTYFIWANMITRCTDPNSSGFHKYGAKGVTVCGRWRRFENFLADMGECPPGLTLDRIKNELGYGPENCRWATMQEQQRNRTNNHLLTFSGETMTLAEWAQRLGIDRHTIHNRLKAGVPMHIVLSPVKHGRDWKPLRT